MAAGAETEKETGGDKIVSKGEEAGAIWRLPQLVEKVYTQKRIHKINRKNAAI